MFHWIQKLFSSEEVLVLTKEMEVKEPSKKKTPAKIKAPTKKPAAKKKTITKKKQ